MKFLALDYGQKRTGVAVSDPSEKLAFPRVTLVKQTRAAFFEHLLELIVIEKPDAIVIGLPVLLDGEDSLTTRQVRNFVASLARRCSLPLYWMQETLSSHEAQQDLHAAGHSMAHMRPILDQQAAVRILQSFLDQSPDKRIRV